MELPPNLPLTKVAKRFYRLWVGEILTSMLREAERGFAVEMAPPVADAFILIMRCGMMTDGQLSVRFPSK